MFYACEEGHISMVEYLVGLGANIYKVNSCGETPLFIAFKNGHTKIVNYLYEIGTYCQIK